MILVAIRRYLDPTRIIQMAAFAIVVPKRLSFSIAESAVLWMYLICIDPAPLVGLKIKAREPMLTTGS